MLGRMPFHLRVCDLKENYNFEDVLHYNSMLRRVIESERGRRESLEMTFGAHSENELPW